MKADTTVALLLLVEIVMTAIAADPLLTAIECNIIPGLPFKAED